jgi:hypothetical protein
MYSGLKSRENNEAIECRLFAQPIDSYQAELEKIVYGAHFAN